MSGSVSVVLSILTGALMMSGRQLTQRFILKDKLTTEYEFLTAQYLIAAFFLIATYVSSWGFEIPSLNEGWWRVLLAAYIPNIFIHVFNAKAAMKRHGEVSLTAPLQAMTPGLLALLAITVGEFPGALGATGILFIMLSSWLILMELPDLVINRRASVIRRAWLSVWHFVRYLPKSGGPFKRLWLLIKMLFGHMELAENERDKTFAVGLAFGSACLGTIALLFDGLYTRRAMNIQGFLFVQTIYSAMLTGIYFVPVLWAHLSQTSAKARVQTGGRTTNVIPPYLALGLVGAGLFVALHWILINPAFNQTFVSYVGTLKRFHILTGVLLGLVIFKEQDFWKRVPAAVLMLIGVVLIGLDELPSRLEDRMRGLGF